MEPWEKVIHEIEKIVRHEALLLGMKLEEDDVYRISLEAYNQVAGRLTPAELFRGELGGEVESVVKYVRIRLRSVELIPRGPRSIRKEEFERADVA